MAEGGAMSGTARTERDGQWQRYLQNGDEDLQNFAVILNADCTISATDGDEALKWRFLLDCPQTLKEVKEDLLLKNANLKYNRGETPVVHTNRFDSKFEKEFKELLKHHADAVQIYNVAIPKEQARMLLDNLNLTELFEKEIIIAYKGETTLYICGMKEYMEKAIKQVKASVDHVLSMFSQTYTLAVNDIPIQLLKKWLNVYILANTSNLKLVLDEEKEVLTITGLENVVIREKEKLEQLLKSITKRRYKSVKIASHLSFFEELEVVKDIEEVLEKQNLVCSWEINKNEAYIVVTAFDKETCEEAVEMIDTAFISESIPLKIDDSTWIIPSASWQEETYSICTKLGGKFKLWFDQKNEKLEYVYTQEIKDKVEHELRSLFDRWDRRTHLSVEKHIVGQLMKKQNLRQLETDYSVAIAVSTKNEKMDLMISGKDSNIQSALGELKREGRNVVNSNLKTSDPLPCCEDMECFFVPQSDDVELIMLKDKSLLRCNESYQAELKDGETGIEIIEIIPRFSLQINQSEDIGANLIVPAGKSKLPLTFSCRSWNECQLKDIHILPAALCNQFEIISSLGGEALLEIKDKTIGNCHVGDFIKWVLYVYHAHVKASTRIVMSRLFLLMEDEEIYDLVQDAVYDVYSVPKGTKASDVQDKKESPSMIKASLYKEVQGEANPVTITAPEASSTCKETSSTKIMTEKKSKSPGYRSWYTIDKKLGERSKLPEEVCQWLENAYCKGRSVTVFKCEKTGSRYIAFLGKENDLSVDYNPYLRLEREMENTINGETTKPRNTAERNQSLKTLTGNKGLEDNQYHSSQPSQPNISQAVLVSAAGSNASSDKPNKNLNVTKKTASGMNKPQLKSKCHSSEPKISQAGEFNGMNKTETSHETVLVSAAGSNASSDKPNKNLNVTKKTASDMNKPQLKSKCHSSEPKISQAGELKGLNKNETSHETVLVSAAGSNASSDKPNKNLNVTKKTTSDMNKPQLKSKELEKLIKERDHLTIQLKETWEKLDTCQTKNVELRGKLIEEKAHITALMKEASDMKLMQDELSDTKFLTEEKIEMLEEKLRNTEHRLSVAEEGHGLVAKELETYKEINGQLTSDIEKTKFDNHCLKAKVTDMEKDFLQKAALMKTKLKECQQDLKGSVQELKKLIKEKDSLASQFEETREKLDTCQTKNVELRGKLIEEQAHITTLNKEASDMNRVKDELNAKIKVLTEELEKLKETREKLDTCQAQNVELRGKVIEEKAHITALMKEASDMKLMQDELSNRKCLTEEKIEMLEEKLRNTEHRLSVAEEGHGLVAKELETYKEINGQLTSDIEELKKLIKERDHLTVQLKETREKLDTCQTQNIELRGKLIEEQAHITTLNKEASDINRIKDELKAKIKVLTEELKKLIKERDHLTIQLKETREKLDTCQTRNVELRGKLIEEQAHITTLNKEASDMNRIKDELKAKIKVLTEELEKLIKERGHLTIQLKETREKLVTWQTQYFVLKGKLIQEKAHITALMEEASDMKLMQDELSNRKCLTEEKIEMLEEKLRNTEHRLSVAEEGHGLVAKELETYKEINGQLTSDIEKTKSDNHCLKAKVSNMEKDFQQKAAIMKTKLKERQQDLKGSVQVYMECKTEVYEDVLNSIKITYGQKGIDSLVSDLDQFAKVEMYEGRVLVLCDYKQADNVQRCVESHYKKARKERKTNDENKHLINGGNYNLKEWLQFAYGDTSWCKNLQLERGKLYLTGTLQMKREVEKAVHSMNYWYQEKFTLTSEEQQKADEVVALVKNELPAVFIKQTKETMIVLSDNRDNFEKAKHKVKEELGRIKITARERRHIDLLPYDESYSGLSKDDKMDAITKFPSSGFQNNQPTAVLTPKSYCTKEGLTAKVYLGNITSLSVDCIVNAASGFLSYGDGVALAISKAAGKDFDPEGEEYVRKNGPIPVTQCCVTSAGMLPYKLVIHAVGPKWSDYTCNEKDSCIDNLKKTIVNCLIKANSVKMASIAIPPLSSGIFGVPKELCAQMYAKGVVEYSKTCGLQSVKEIHFVDTNSEMCQLTQSAFDKELQCG